MKGLNKNEPHPPSDSNLGALVAQERQQVPSIFTAICCEYVYIYTHRKRRGMKREEERLRDIEREKEKGREIERDGKRETSTGYVKCVYVCIKRADFVPGV